MIKTTFANPTILVVDDEKTQRLLTRDHLEREGFTVAEAASGEDALSALEENQPGLILLDVKMPGMDGLEVCRRVRANPDTKYIPIMMVTGSENTADLVEGFSAGATDFLTKPIKWDLLHHRVKFILRAAGFEKRLRDGTGTANDVKIERPDNRASVEADILRSVSDIAHRAGDMLKRDLDAPIREDLRAIKESSDKAIALLGADAPAPSSDPGPVEMEDSGGASHKGTDAGHSPVTQGNGVLRVLVAEDNRLNQSLISAMLTTAGCDVDLADNGLEALNAVGKQAYDLVLMDIQMPEMDGVTATQKIRELPDPLSHVPVIAVTANETMNDPARLREARLDDYISKPIQPAQMTAAIRRHCALTTELQAVVPTVSNSEAHLSAQQAEAVNALSDLLDDLNEKP